MKNLFFVLLLIGLIQVSCCRDCLVSTELKHIKTYSFPVDSFAPIFSFEEFCKEEKKEMDGKIVRYDTIVMGLKMTVVKTYDCSKN